MVIIDLIRHRKGLGKLSRENSKLFYVAVGENIKKYRKIRNLSLQILAEKVGLTKKTIQRYENGEHRIDMDRLNEIASALDVDIVALLDGTDSFLGTNITDLKLAVLPIVKEFKQNNNSIEFKTIEGYESAPAEWNVTDNFYVRSSDNSMIDSRIGEGDLLLIDPKGAENGDIAVIQCNGKLLIRKMFINGNQFLLQPANSSYDPIFCERGDAFVIGKVKKCIINF